MVVALAVAALQKVRRVRRVRRVRDADINPVAVKVRATVPVECEAEKVERV